MCSVPLPVGLVGVWAALPLPFWPVLLPVELGAVRLVDTRSLTIAAPWATQDPSTCWRTHLPSRGRSTRIQIRTRILN